MSLPCVILPHDFHVPHDKPDLLRLQPQPTSLKLYSTRSYTLATAHYFPNTLLCNSCCLMAKSYLLQRPAQILAFSQKAFQPFSLLNKNLFLNRNQPFLYSNGKSFTLLFYCLSHDLIIVYLVLPLDVDDPKNKGHGTPEPNTGLVDSWPSIWCVPTACLGKNEGRKKIKKAYSRGLLWQHSQ